MSNHHRTGVVDMEGKLPARNKVWLEAYRLARKAFTSGARAAFPINKRLFAAQ